MARLQLEDRAVRKKRAKADQSLEEGSDDPKIDMGGETITPIGKTPGYIIQEDHQHIENMLEAMSGGDDRAGLKGDSEALQEAYTTIEVKKGSPGKKRGTNVGAKTPGPNSTKGKSLKSQQKSAKSRSIKQGSVKSKGSPLKSAGVIEGSIDGTVREEGSIADEVIPVVKVREQQN